MKRYLLAFALMAFPASAQIVVSANDGKQVLVDGAQTVPARPAADSLTVLRFSQGKARVLKTLVAPASVIGPPASVAISPDGHYAIVTAARKIGADPTRIVPDDKVTVIALARHHIRIVQHTHAGAGASGVAFAPDGGTVLIANRAEGTVSVFGFAKGRLTEDNKVDLGNPKASPATPLFFAGGRRALVTRDGDNRISVLAIDGGQAHVEGAPVLAGQRPYEITSAGDRRYAVVADIGGNGKTDDSINLIDLSGPRPKVVDTETVGLTPEGVRMSPNGRFVAVNVNNGSNNPHEDATWHADGELQVWAIADGKLRRVTTAPVGAWGQGIAWSADGRQLLAQSMVAKSLEAFAFDGRTLIHRFDIPVPAGPAAIAASSR